MSDSADIIVGEVSKSRGNRIRVSIRCSNGIPFLDVRNFSEKPNGYVMATGKGFGLGLRSIDQLIELLEDAIDTAEARGLLKPTAEHGRVG
jgi:hypothetical protein